MLPGHARCVLSRLRCNGYSLLLGSYLSRIGEIENPSWSACGHSSQDTSYLILHCPARDSLHPLLFGEFRSLYNVWSRPWELGGFWGSMVFCMPPSLGRGRVTNNNNNNKPFVDQIEPDLSTCDLPHLKSCHNRSSFNLKNSTITTVK